MTVSIILDASVVTRHEVGYKISGISFRDDMACGLTIGWHEIAVGNAARPRFYLQHFRYGMANCEKVNMGKKTKEN